MVLIWQVFFSGIIAVFFFLHLTTECNNAAHFRSEMLWLDSVRLGFAVTR